MFFNGADGQNKLVRSGLTALWRCGTAAVLLAGLILTGITGTARGAESPHWIGTWAAAPQNFISAHPTIYQDQTLRLIVHTSAGGKKVRIRISNTYGDQPLVIGSAHAARRAAGADIDSKSDRALTFGGKQSVTIAGRGAVVSDAVEFDVPPLSDLAISLFLPQSTTVSPAHILAK